MLKGRRRSRRRRRRAGGFVCVCARTRPRALLRLGARVCDCPGAVLGWRSCVRVCVRARVEGERGCRFVLLGCCVSSKRRLRAVACALSRLLGTVCVRLAVISVCVCLLFEDVGAGTFPFQTGGRGRRRREERREREGREMSDPKTRATSPARNAQKNHPPTPPTRPPHSTDRVATPRSIERAL